MAYNIVLKKRALENLWEAMDYYEKQSSGLEKRLMNEFFNRLNDLREHPERYGPIYKHFRRIPLKKFPYKIVFAIDEPRKRVVVLVLWHERRNTETLRGWLEE